jgi:hypothetical protein
MLRRLIQAIGHCGGALLGYDLCIASCRDEHGVFRWRFKWARIEIKRKTRYVLAWSFRAGDKTQFFKTYDSYAEALPWADALVIRGDCSCVEIWQEDTVDRLVSRRTKVC